MNRITKTIRGPRLVLASIAILSLALAGQANAQYRATDDDGITASPKVRATLNERKARIAVPAGNAAIATVMRCAKCKDVLISVPDTETKGLGTRSLLAKSGSTKAVATHLCTACDTKWQVNGVGKAKQAVAIHSCGVGAKDLVCCSSETPKALKK